MLVHACTIACLPCFMLRGHVVSDRHACPCVQADLVKHAGSRVGTPPRGRAARFLHPVLRTHVHAYTRSMHAYMRVIVLWVHAFAHTPTCSGTGAFETGGPDLWLNYCDSCCHVGRACVHACMHAWTFQHACLHPVCALVHYERIHEFLPPAPLIFRFVISVFRCFRRMPRRCGHD